MATFLVFTARNAATLLYSYPTEPNHMASLQFVYVCVCPLSELCRLVSTRADAPLKKLKRTAISDCFDFRHFFQRLFQQPDRKSTIITVQNTNSCSLANYITPSLTGKKNHSTGVKWIVVCGSLGQMVKRHETLTTDFSLAAVSSTTALAEQAETPTNVLDIVTSSVSQ